MAIALSDVIAGVRAVHPAFDRSKVPDGSIARFLTGYQRELTGKALQIDKTFLAQQMSVGFAVASANGVNAGAGSGQRPVDATVGVLSAINAPLGTGVEVDVSGSDVVTLVAEFVAASPTATSVNKTGAGWTTNAYVNKTMVVTGGTGAGSLRTITSNDSDTLNWSGNLTLDTTSLIKVVTSVEEADETFGVVLDGPFHASRTGFAVRVNSSGTAYLDLTTPITASVGSGIPLPEVHMVIGGNVHFTNGDTPPMPLTLVDYGSRANWRSEYAAYVMGQQLFLCGEEADWTDVQSLDLRYVPVPPAITALTSTFLLPDSAYSALVNASAAVAGIRVQGMGASVNVAALQLQADKSELAFLRVVSAGKRNRKTIIKDWLGN